LERAKSPRGGDAKRQLWQGPPTQRAALPKGWHGENTVHPATYGDWRSHEVVLIRGSSPGVRRSSSLLFPPRNVYDPPSLNRTGLGRHRHAGCQSRPEPRDGASSAGALEIPIRSAKSSQDWVLQSSAALALPAEHGSDSPAAREVHCS